MPPWLKTPLGAALLVACALSVPVGCTGFPRQGSPPALPPESPAQQPQWWRARFRMDWPTGGTPAWHVDACIAHRLVSPALERRGGRIPFWRFHRRAARDEAGHQFSFVFFTDARTAAEVFEAIEADPLLARLKATGAVETVLTGPDGADASNGVAATSDPRWPPAIRQAWPRFIMGVSALWLDLVDQVSETIAAEKPENADSPDHYLAVHQEIVRLWREEGGHAFLHHLSAVFAYEPLYVVEKRLMGF